MGASRRLIAGVGYLGSRVARLWLARSEHVYATTRSPERFHTLRQQRMEPILWDVLDPPAGELPQVDTVLYCVGFDRNTGASMREVYVDGLQRTLERLPTPGRLIYISSTGVYGHHHGEWVDEETPPAPADPSGQVCLEAENVLIDHCHTHGIEYAILRLAGIYGPGRMIGVQSLARGEPIAAVPDVYLNLIEVSDAARFVDAVTMVTELPSQLFLVSDGNPVTRREFYEEVAKIHGFQQPHFQPDEARRQRGNRRIRNARMMQLMPDLQYGDFRLGLRHALKDD